MFRIVPVAAFSDNYIWLIIASGETVPASAIIVDPGAAGPVIDYLERHGIAAAAILLTHHHFDHVGGVDELRDHAGVPVYGPARSAVRAIDHRLRDGDRVDLGAGIVFDILEVPGHTLDHIAYYGNELLLCGDTLFGAGCGRLFEGTPEQMYRSLRRLAALPPATRICCAHEYTVANLKFACAVEPDNAAIRARLEAAVALRAAGRPTLPSTLAVELATNPFLRCGQAAVYGAAAHRLGHAPDGEVGVFAALRQWKDGFSA